MRSQNLLSNAVALSAGLVIALLVGEIVARIAGGPPAWFLFSGSFRDRRTGWEAEYHVDDQMRRVSCDEPAEGAAGRSNVAVIGDSFVFGQSVPDCRDFVSLLNLRQDAVHYENFGVIGSGPVQYRMIARDMIDETYDGALVVFYGNDFPIHGGERSRLGSLADHSSLFALLRKAKRRLQVRERMREIDEAGLDGSHIELFNNIAAMVKGPMPAYARLSVDPGEEHVRDFSLRFSRIVETLERRIPRDAIAVSMVPQGSVVSPALRGFVVGLGGEVAPFGERGTAYRVVERLAAEHGLRFIETFDVFLAHGDAAYWHDDFHWNEFGHERMAELVGQAYGLSLR